MKRYKLHEPSWPDLRRWAARLRRLDDAAVTAASDKAAAQAARLACDERTQAATLALPASWRTRDKLLSAPWPAAGDSRLWRAVGASDAFLAPLSPAHGVGLFVPSYCEGYFAIQGAYLMTDIKTEADMSGLFVALIAAQAEVRSMPKDGKNAFHGYSYATAEAVIAAGRDVLTRHGLALVRVSSSTLPPDLLVADVGKPNYVGEVRVEWLLVHSGGASMPISAEIPVVADKATPHDKATKASETYGTGYAILGLLCQDRAEKSSVDARLDRGVPTCSPDMAESLASGMERYAKMVNADKYEAWDHLLNGLGIAPAPPRDLGVDDAQRALDRLRGWIDAKTEKVPAQGPKYDAPGGFLEQVAEAQKLRLALSTLTVDPHLDAIEVWALACSKTGAPAREPEKLTPDHLRVLNRLLRVWLDKKKAAPAADENTLEEH